MLFCVCLELSNIWKSKGRCSRYEGLQWAVNLSQEAQGHLGLDGSRLWTIHADSPNNVFLDLRGNQNSGRKPINTGWACKLYIHPDSSHIYIMTLTMTSAMKMDGCSIYQKLSMTLHIIKTTWQSFSGPSHVIKIRSIFQPYLSVCNPIWRIISTREGTYSEIGLWFIPKLYPEEWVTAVILGYDLWNDS